MVMVKITDYTAQINDIYHVLGLQEPLSKKFIAKALDLIVVFDKKQSDYGNRNIGDFGREGLVVRLNDKVQRLRNLIWGKKNAANEATKDTWLDIAGYGIIGGIVEDGDWPGASPS